MSDACDPSGGSSAAGTKPCCSSEDEFDDDAFAAAFAAAAAAAAAFALLEAPNLAVGSAEKRLLSSKGREEHDKAVNREGESDDDGDDGRANAAAIDRGESAREPRRRRATSAAAEEARARLIVWDAPALLMLCSRFLFSLSDVCREERKRERGKALLPLRNKKK